MHTRSRTPSPSTGHGTDWAAVKQMVTDGRIAPDEVVVCLVSGNGLKDIASARQVAGLPQVINPSIEALEAALISQ